MAKARRSRADSIDVVRRPPVPRDEGPGPMDVPFSFSGGPLESLDGEPVAFSVFDTDDHLDAMFAGLAAKNPDIASYFALAFADGFGSFELLNLMLTYGRMGRSGTPPPGSLALLDGHWLIVLACASGQLTSAVRLSFGDDGPTYRVETLKGISLSKCQTVWVPTSERVLHDGRIGTFWGPVLSRYRQLLSARPGNISDLLDAIFPSFRFDTSSFASVAAIIERELYPMTPDLPLWPGAIVLTERDDEIAVVLPDGTLLGVRQDHVENLADRMALAKFKPAFIWYPHL